MPYNNDDDDWDDEFDDEDAFLSDDEPTVRCPYCGELVHEDAQRCPHCENYISEEDAPARKKPWWILAGVLVCLYMIYRWTVG